MDSILFLVGAIVLNLVLKSIQDKRRAEEARNKRINLIGSSETKKDNQQPISKKAKEPSLIQELITIFNEEVGKRNKEDKEPATIFKNQGEPRRETPRKEYQEEEWVGSQAKVTESAYKDFSEEHYRRGGHRDLEEEARLEAESQALRREGLKKDILNGIIFSEILAEPKALKRSI